jgi:hypothetical protein
VTKRQSLIAGLRGRRSQAALPHEPTPPTAHSRDVAAVQIMAHTLIADLFGAGLRVQHLAARAPSDLQEGLAEVTDQIDKVIGELRGFAFTHRG